jgi:hypothetical protein
MTIDTATDIEAMDFQEALAGVGYQKLSMD